MNHYYLKARLFPTILTAIPAIAFFNFFVAPLYSQDLANIFSALPVVTNVTFSSALVFLFVQLNRFCAKEVFQRFYFRDERAMPTTEHLLWVDKFFDRSVKESIRDQIKSKYGISLLSADEEKADEGRARKLIAAAVSQIRISLKDNPMLFQHNIEYGFFRNLVGGSLLAELFSLLIIVFAWVQENQKLRGGGIVLLVVYLIPLFASKVLITRYGNYYSRVLFEQFLGQTI